jgi:hypothetical protein
VVYMYPSYKNANMSVKSTKVKIRVSY